MKRTSLLLGLPIIAAMASCSQKAENVTLANEQDTLSWAMGMSLAETMKSGFYPFDNDLVKQAFLSAMNGESQPLDPDTYQAACQYIAFLAQKKQRDDMKKAANQSAASEKEIFDRLIKEHPDVKKSPEGYYYQVIKEGSGPKAKIGQRVRFDFSSTNLISNQEYASSRNRESIIHVLGSPMIPGMQSGMQLMNAGSKYIFYFPSQQAFGSQGSEDLPPFTPLKYEIELHEIYTD